MNLNYYKPKAEIVIEPTASQEYKKVFNDVLELIAFCARVSNPSNQFNNDTAEKLIRYLIKHKHWSPLEMASVTIGLDTTRDITHQVVRHRSFKFQEFSQRYANPDDLDNMFVLREARLQDTKNRQNSVESDDEELKNWWEDAQKQVIQLVYEKYTQALEKGIAKECARVILPEGNTCSKIYMAGDIRSWIHYLELRSANGTQKEHMELAKVIAKAIAKIFPMTKELIGETNDNN
jgi:thymidylate synthase (FAD)